MLIQGPAGLRCGQFCGQIRILRVDKHDISASVSTSPMGSSKKLRPSQCQTIPPSLILLLLFLLLLLLIYSPPPPPPPSPPLHLCFHKNMFGIKYVILSYATRPSHLHSVRVNSWVFLFLPRSEAMWGRYEARKKKFSHILPPKIKTIFSLFLNVKSMFSPLNISVRGFEPYLLV